MKLIHTILNQQPRVASILTVILMLWVTGGMAIQSFDIWNILEASDESPHSTEQSVPADDSTDQPSATTLSSVNEAVIPIIKIQILFFCNFFQELDLVEEVNTFPTKNVPLPASRFFLTLFRQIISPNAP